MKQKHFTRGIDYHVYVFVFIKWIWKQFYLLWPCRCQYFKIKIFKNQSCLENSWYMKIHWEVLFHLYLRHDDICDSVCYLLFVKWLNNVVYNSASSVLSHHNIYEKLAILVWYSHTFPPLFDNTYLMWTFSLKDLKS